MGKTIISEDIFSELVEVYNREGKTSAYDMIRNRYGVKNPFFVINRIKKYGKYTYDPENDRFSDVESDAADHVFMDLDELCGTVVPKATEKTGIIGDSRPEAMERLVHELISDRLMMLSRYITLDSSSRTIMIDQSSLSADGYRIVTH